MCQIGTEGFSPYSDNCLIQIRNSFMQNTNILRRTAIAAGLLLGAAVAVPAIAADNYPSKAITMVVGYPAGGSTDLVGRLVADGLVKQLGQPVVVENLGGAGGAIGAQKWPRPPPTVTPSWWVPTMSWPLPGSSTRP